VLGNVLRVPSCRVCKLCRAIINMVVSVGKAHVEKRTTNLRSFVKVNLSTEIIRRKGSSESLMLHAHEVYASCKGRKWSYDANMSGLSR